MEHLGHPNALISGLAFDEVSCCFKRGLALAYIKQLLRLSDHSSFMAMRLFDPYWRTIATTVIKDLHARPQTIQRICDLLNIKVPDFLTLTQTYTIPYLLSATKWQVLQRVADARSPEYSIWSLCTEPANMAAIIAYLLLQPSTDVEHMMMASLYEASPEFKEFDLAQAINSVPIPVACELLKVAGEEDEKKKTRVSTNCCNRQPITQLISIGLSGYYIPRWSYSSQVRIFKGFDKEERHNRVFLRDFRAWDSCITLGDNE